MYVEYQTDSVSLHVWDKGRNKFCETAASDDAILKWKFQYPYCQL